MILVGKGQITFEIRIGSIKFPEWKFKRRIQKMRAAYFLQSSIGVENEGSMRYTLA